MQWTHKYYEQIQHLLPKQRGNVEIDNRTFFEAMIHLTENGLRWRVMPEKYGKRNTFYRRFRRWTDNGVFERIEKHLQPQAVSKKRVTILALDSTYIKVHPDGTGASKKKDCSPSVKAAAVGRPRFIRLLPMNACPLFVGGFGRGFAGRTEIDGDDTSRDLPRQAVVDG